ncbi:hypothetical protein L1887_12485 [Cichorium endivia]|nr:hypothetical protein L1887_12485 [Cichorium endivia]
MKTRTGNNGVACAQKISPGVMIKIAIKRKGKRAFTNSAFPALSPFHFQLKSLTLTLAPLIYLSLSSTSSTIAFCIADKSILILDLGLNFSRTFLLKLGKEYARQNSESFGCNFFTKSISVGVEDKELVIAGTENVDLDANVRKFSNSRSNEDARFLNECAQSFINWRSASVESHFSPSL